jgi:hypothetical protein
MSRIDNRPKIEITKIKNNVDENVQKEVLKGRKVITGSNGKVEKEKKMFYLPKVLTRALELYACEERKNSSEICTLALENIIPKHFIERADKESKTI